jgi:hypothetical protein
MRTTHFWMYEDRDWPGEQLVGYDVQALDGEIGSVAEAMREVVGRYLVVDAGRWISGKKVVLPGAIVERVDPRRNTVFVNRTRQEIADAPDYHALTFRTHAYRAELDRYYAPGGPGFRPGSSVRVVSDAPV